MADEAFTDETPVRDFWTYVGFSTDPCGNVGVSTPSGGVLNYHLGDVVPGPTPGDNQVVGVDISELGDAYGEVHGGPFWNPQVDVGPLEPDGRPTTDDVIDFDDLLPFAMSFKSVSREGDVDLGADPSRSAARVELETEREDDRRLAVRLRLLDHVDRVKGAHTVVAYDPAAPDSRRRRTWRLGSRAVAGVLSRARPAGRRGRRRGEPRRGTYAERIGRSRAPRLRRARSRFSAAARRGGPPRRGEPLRRERRYAAGGGPGNRGCPESVPHVHRPRLPASGVGPRHTERVRRRRSPRCGPSWIAGWMPASTGCAGTGETDEVVPWARGSTSTRFVPATWRKPVNFIGRRRSTGRWRCNQHPRSASSESSAHSSSPRRRRPRTSARSSTPLTRSSSSGGP